MCFIISLLSFTGLLLLDLDLFFSFFLLFSFDRDRSFFSLCSFFSFLSFFSFFSFFSFLRSRSGDSMRLLITTVDGSGDDPQRPHEFRLPEGHQPVRRPAERRRSRQAQDPSSPSASRGTATFRVREKNQGQQRHSQPRCQESEVLSGHARQDHSRRHQEYHLISQPAGHGLMNLCLESNKMEDCA